MIIAVVGIIFYPNLKKIINPSTADLIQLKCLEEDTKKAITEIIKKGGRLNPELYINYEGEKVEYLCYTEEWYKTCVMQKPLIKQSIEAEAERTIEKSSKKCIEDMIERLKKKGYDVKVSGDKSVNINIMPEKVEIAPNIEISLKKDGESKILDRNMFKSSYYSGVYEIITIAGTVLNWEARFGDVPVESLMNYYHNLLLKKIIQSDGSKIYIIKNIDENIEMRFAVRSLSWPAGIKIQ
jgi:hypothetical protein